MLSPLKNKCRWFDCIEIESTSIPISFKNNRIYSLLESRNHGFGIRVNKSGKTGFSYTNQPAHLAETAMRAIDLALFGDREEFSLPPNPPSLLFEPYDPCIETVSIDNEILKGRGLIDTLIAEFPALKVDCGIAVSKGKNRIINSSEFDVSYQYSRYSVSVNATYTFPDGSILSVGEGFSRQGPADFFDLADILIRKLNDALTVRKTTGGRVPVLLTPKAFAGMLGILTAGFSARNVYKGISPFADQREQRVFNDSITLIDDPHLDNSPFSYPFDDEGVQAQTKPIIEYGVIKNFVTDLKHASQLGLVPGGNGMRGYSTPPFPSFSNIVVNAGVTGLAEMESSIDRGIIVDQFIGLGQSNTLTGDFSANMDLAYLVEKGKITGRIKDCMLTDNLFNLLADEVILSREREIHGSTLLPSILLPSVNLIA